MDEKLSKEEAKAIEVASGSGNKIEAIKLYQNATGKGLEASKEYVEASISKLKNPSSVDVKAIETALEAGNKMEAIKLYRNASGKGLKESKEFVEALITKLKEHDPEKYAKLSNSKGCGLLVVCVLGVIALSVMWWLN